MDQAVVLGAPRSGTTFLMNFLDAMPRVEAVSGNLLPTVIPHLFNQELPAVARRALLGAFGRSLTDYLESGAFNARSAALRKYIASRRGLGDVVTGRRSVEGIIYKEPFLAFAPQYVYEALPEARLIYILRDGRDVADSLVRTYDVLTDEKLSHTDTTEAPITREHGKRFVPWWVEAGREDEFLAASQYVRAIWMWAAMVRRCRTFLATDVVKGSGRVLHVRYEDVVTEPALWGSTIAGHLSRHMTRRMRHRIESGHRQSIGIHQRRNSTEIAEALRVAGPELREHAYL